MKGMVERVQPKGTLEKRLEHSALPPHKSPTTGVLATPSRLKPHQAHSGPEMAILMQKIKIIYK